MNVKEVTVFRFLSILYRIYFWSCVVFKVTEEKKTCLRLQSFVNDKGSDGFNVLLVTVNILSSGDLVGYRQEFAGLEKVIGSNSCNWQKKVVVIVYFQSLHRRYLYF